MLPYAFKISVGLDFYVFEVEECDAGAGWIAVEVKVHGEATGKKQGVGDDMEAAVLDAVESLLPAQVADPEFMREVSEQFAIQLVSLPV